MQHVVGLGLKVAITSDVISGTFVGPVVPDNRVKFGDPRLNRSQEIPPDCPLRRHLHTCQVYKHTGYDVTTTSGRKMQRKTVENAASDSFR